MERMEQMQKPDATIGVPEGQPPVKAEAGAVRFLVRQLRFTPSEIFTAAELDAFAREHEGRELALADLQNLAASINAAYRQRGVVTARAVLPPQDVSTGVIEIRLVEGRLGGIRLDGNASTTSGYITSRIRLKPGDLVDLPALEQDLLRFNRTNDVQLRAKLAPGSVFATTDLELAATEPQRHQARLFVDNGGSRSSGEWRGGLAYFNRSLLGYRDELALSSTQSGGQHSYAVNYGVPVNRSGGRLSAGYFKDYSHILHGPYATLDISGESASIVLSLRQPLHIAKAMQVDLLAGAKERKTDNWASGAFLNRTDTLDGSIGAEIQHADAQGYWVGSYSYTRGSAKELERTGYWYGRGWLRRQQKLTGDWSLAASLSFQNTSNELLPVSEQLIIGGEGTVRGYPVGTYAGETGYTLTAELHHPLGAAPLGDGVPPLAASGFFFVDFGHVRPYRPPSSVLRGHEQLTGAGWGVNAAIGKRISSRMALAYALDNIPDGMPSHLTLQFQLVVTLY
jgi:hemolysin activation/secretion protein